MKVDAAAAAVTRVVDSVYTDESTAQTAKQTINLDNLTVCRSIIVTYFVNRHYEIM